MSESVHSLPDQSHRYAKKESDQNLEVEIRFKRKGKVFLKGRILIAGEELDEKKFKDPKIQDAITKKTNKFFNDYVYLVLVLFLRNR